LELSNSQIKSQKEFKMSSTNAVYIYDKLGRLTNVTFPTGAMATYSYDTAGNRTTVVEVPSITPPPPPSPMAAGFPNRIAGDFKNTPMMVMLTGGELMGWGDNATGVLANGVEAATNNLPQLVLFDPNTTVPPPSATIVSWVFTNANVYVAYSNGWVYSAGSNDYGQLGHGDTTDRPFLKRIEFFVTNALTITKIWAGGGYSSANGGGCVFFQASNNLAMYGCGLNLAGNLGNAATPTTNVLTPALCNGINATSASHVVDVKVVLLGTNASTYMLLNDGTLMVAGYNGQGQLGINSLVVQSGIFTSATNPSGNISNAAAISANGGSTLEGNALYVDTSGGVWTVGYNLHGELAVGTTVNAKVFAQVTALSTVVITKAELGGGASGFGYAIDSTGKLYTWGYNGQNNLFKDSSTTPQSTPAVVPAGNLPTGVISKVFFAKGEQGLATTAQLIILTTNGQLVYAGADNGQIGITDPVSGAFNRIATPQDLMDGTDTVVDLFVHGTGLTQRWFVLTANGNLYGCGQNADCICTGGVSSSVPALNAQWQPIILG
jgi:YD repeat-containing protein